MCSVLNNKHVIISLIGLTDAQNMIIFKIVKKTEGIPTLTADKVIIIYSYCLYKYYPMVCILLLVVAIICP